MSVPPLGLPVDAPLHAKSWVRPAGSTEFRVTQNYGDINTAVSKAIHGGTDIGSGQLPGRKVYAPEAGTVIDEGWLFGPWSQATSDALKARWNGSPNWGGVMCVIRLSQDYIWAGAHLADTVINKGQKVAAGQLVGHVGNTGAAFEYGTHIHNDLYRRLATGESSGALAAINYGGYRWRKVDMWPLLEQNYVLPPDTSISEEIPMWVNDLVPIAPSRGEIRPGAKLHRSPDANSPVAVTIGPEGYTATVIAGLGTDWLVYLTYEGGPIFVSRADVIDLDPIGSGPTADEVRVLVEQGRQAGARDTAKVATDYAAKQ